MGVARVLRTRWLSRVLLDLSSGRQALANIVARREVSIVVFDSSVPIDTGQGVYMSVAAEHVDGDEVTDGIELFSRRSLGHGGDPSRRTTSGAPARDFGCTGPPLSSSTRSSLAPTGTSRCRRSA